MKAKMKEELEKIEKELENLKEKIIEKRSNIQTIEKKLTQLKQEFQLFGMKHDQLLHTKKTLYKLIEGDNNE